jgi:outer membrane protein OmpU
MNKKFLLGTTSLVAATVLAGGNALAEAQPLNLSLSGYYGFDVHLYSEDQEGGADNHGMVTAQDAEINFNMRGELDNGMKIGGRIELEASNAGDQIDQSWITLEAGWGRVDIGAANSGRYNLSWDVNAPNVAHGISSGVQTEWLSQAAFGGFAFRRPLGSANVDASNDDQGIHYYSPRFNGFQVALSYRPEVATTQGGGGGGSNSGQIDEGVSYHDGIDIGVIYAGDVGGVGLTATVGYATASAPGNALSAVTNGGTESFDDYETLTGGFRLSWDGFRVGGMIANVTEGFCVETGDGAGGAVDNDCADATDRSTAGTAYTFGGSYGQGPWAVSAQMHSGDIEDSIGVAGDSTLDVWSLSGSYTLGPGLRVIASYQDADLNNEDNVAANGNEGNSFSIGVAAGF